MILTTLIVFITLIKFEQKYSKFGLDLKKIGAYLVLGIFSFIIILLANLIMIFLSFFTPTFVALGIVFFVSIILPKKES